MHIVNAVCAIVMMLAMLFVITSVIQKMWGVQHGFARIILGPILNDIRNAMGALVFSAWKGIHYVREKAATVTNPNSLDQANIRARVTSASKRWTHTLTSVQRAAWENYAQGLGSASSSEQAQEGGTKVVIPDNRGIMSGFNSYVMVNCWAYTGGVMPAGTWQDDAPIGIDAPNAPTNLECSWAAEQCQIALTWTDPEEPPTITGGMIRVWTVSLDAGVHRQIVTTVALGVELYNLENLKVTLGALSKVWLLPGNYHLQIDCIGPNGQKSPPSNVCQIEVPANCTPTS